MRARGKEPSYSRCSGCSRGKPNKSCCRGLAAIGTVYPHVAHQRCWVHKMRNILERVRKRDYDAMKQQTQAIYLAENRRRAEEAC